MPLCITAPVSVDAATPIHPSLGQHALFPVIVASKGTFGIFEALIYEQHANDTNGAQYCSAGCDLSLGQAKYVKNCTIF